MPSDDDVGMMHTLFETIEFDIYNDERVDRKYLLAHKVNERYLEQRKQLAVLNLLQTRHEFSEDRNA